MALISEEQAQTVSRLTVQWLKNRGWCFWKCEALADDIVTVIRDSPPLSHDEEMALMKQLAAHYERHPEGVTTDWLGVPYTLTELRHLCRLDDMILTHEAKKAGAVIDSVEVAQ